MSQYYIRLSVLKLSKYIPFLQREEPDLTAMHKNL
jgi:hypothetical protein